MNRFPTLHRDPTMPVARTVARNPGTVATAARHLNEVDPAQPPVVRVHPDRLEIVSGDAAGARHRRPLDPRPTPRPSSETLLVLGVAVVTALVALGSALGLSVPSPLAAALTVLALPLVGAGPLRLLRRATGLHLPDPLTRLLVAAALGLVLLTGLLRLADLAGLDPAPVVVALSVGVLTLLPRVLRPVPSRPLRRPRRDELLLLPLLALPVLGWIDVAAGPSSPGWLRFAVLVAGLVLLGRVTLLRRTRPRRSTVAATLYALAVAVLTPLQSASTDSGWTGTLAALFTLDGERIEQVVLPAVTSLVVVAAWLAGERVLGPVRAVVVGTLVLAVLVAAPPAWGDLPIAAAALVVLGARGARARLPLTGRRILVGVLAAGALLLAPSATVFAAQVCLVALVSLTLGRTRTHVLTLPVALGLAVTVWIATSLRGDLPLGAGTGTGPVPLAAVVVAGLAAVGLVWAVSVALVGRDRSARQDGEFLLLAAAGLLVQAVATAASPEPSTSYVPHVALLATVPAVLGIAGVWAAVSTLGGATLDRVPGRWLRTGARATRGHRRTPRRLRRTALVALVLFAVEYARRAFS